MDERQPKESYKSRVAHMSIDCKIGRHKLLALFLYDDHMGKGKVLKEMQDLKEDGDQQSQSLLHIPF